MSSDNFILELYRSNLGATTGLMNTWLDGMERIQNSQFQAAREALSEQMEAIDELRAQPNVERLISAQGRLVRTQFAGALARWTEFCAIGRTNHAELTDQAQSKVLGSVQSVIDSLDAVPDALQPAVMPMRIAANAAKSACEASLNAAAQAGQALAARAPASARHRGAAAAARQTGT